MKRELKSKEDVAYMVDEFYKRIRSHKELGPIFNNVIGNLWVLHLDTLTRFWQTLLLGERTYFGAPFPKHIKIDIAPHNFDQWIALFIHTIDELFEGKKAEEAKLRATNIAKTFKYKHGHIREELKKQTQSEGKIPPHQNH